jgi:uncharacterized membrane protein
MEYKFSGLPYNFQILLLYFLLYLITTQYRNNKLKGVCVFRVICVELMNLYVFLYEGELTAVICYVT